jgi:SPP1 family predicted phage head-tail adaptor
MNAGRLRHRIELQSKTEATNSFGEVTLTYSTYTTVWAEIRPLQGRELETAQQISADVNHKVTIRYNSSVVETDRILFGTRVLEIGGIVNTDERNIEQVLFCKEVK